MDGYTIRVSTILTTVFCTLIKLGDCIDCFECFSLQGNNRDCEDEFGPDNKTAHLVTRNCKVGYLRFKANYCVKIKGTKKRDGKSVLIRTCAMEDWGTQCGDIFFEQETFRDELTGCLATCPFDGCNSAPPTGGGLVSITVENETIPALKALLWNYFLALLCPITAVVLSRGGLYADPILLQTETFNGIKKLS